MLMIAGKGQVSTAKDETKPFSANYYQALRPISLIGKGPYQCLAVLGRTSKFRGRNFCIRGLTYWIFQHLRENC